MSSLDPSVALLVVDVQKGILTMPPAKAATNLVTANARLADAFHAAALPVIWIHATGLPAGRVERPIPEPEELPSDFSELDERLPAHPQDHHVYKSRTWSAFQGTNLATRLQSLGITQVVIGGIATGAGVESTARSAYDLSLTVTVVADACFDGNSNRHTSCLSEDVPSFGLVTTVDSVVSELTARISQ